MVLVDLLPQNEQGAEDGNSHGDHFIYKVIFAP